MNIPFINALSQMPMHAKLLKEFLSKKRKINGHKTIAFGKKCSVVVLNKPLTKLKDPDSFSIPCLIENVSIDRALWDRGSSVSLMPYSFFKRLDLGKLTPTTISLQLADRSVNLGILEDILIKVGDFCVLIDFVILDMAKDAHTQIFLGWPFWLLQDAE